MRMLQTTDSELPIIEERAVGEDGPACSEVTVPSSCCVLAEMYTTASECLQTFNEENRCRFTALLGEIAGSLSRMEKAKAGKLLSLILSVHRTAYFHFSKDEMYALCLAMLRRNACLNVQTKIEAYEFLLTHYDHCRLYGDLIKLYDRMDGFRMRGIPFRNYALQRMVEFVICVPESASGHAEGQPRKKKKREGLPLPPVSAAVNKLVQMSEWLESCSGFVEHIVRHCDEFACRSVLIAYTYKWLRDVKVDLFNIKNPCEVQEVNGNVIGRIFSVFKDMRKAACEHSTGEEVRDCAGVPDDVFLITQLFGRSDVKCVFASVYKRIAFYFLVHNRRAFQTNKILRVFNKSEQQRIYRALRGNKAALVNVFSQLDKRYLMKELVKTADFFIFNSIDPADLHPSDLYAYYESYFRIAEAEQLKDYQISFAQKESPVDLQERLEVFARAFNAQADKTFSSFVRIKPTGSAITVSPAIAAMLVDYTAFQHGLFFDLVFFCAVLCDNPSQLLLKKNIHYYNDVLSVLYNVSNTIHTALGQRLLPLLCKLLSYDVYALRAGMLLSKIANIEILERLLISQNVSDTKNSSDDPARLLPIDIKVLAALNHPMFEESLASRELSQKDYELAVLYYIHHNPAFANKHLDLLYNILNELTANNSRQSLATPVFSDSPAHLLLLYLSRLDAESAFPFSFVSDNIQLFYDLAVFSPLITSIFLKQLRARAILPCMVIPHIILCADLSYALRVYSDTVVNCLPGALFLLLTRIKNELNSQSLEDYDDRSLSDPQHGGECADAQEMPIDQTDENMVEARTRCTAPDTRSASAATKLISKESLRAIIDSQLKFQFIERIISAVGVKKVVAKLPPISDPLMAFIVIRQLRGVSKENKELFLHALEENTQEESILELIGKAKVFYSKMGRGIIPLEFVLGS